MRLIPNYNNQKEAYVVVSGVATGIGIAPALRGYGYEVLHITSDLQKSLGHSHNACDYVKSFEETKNIQQLVKEIQREWNVKAIIPGAEAGVDLAEKLNLEFKLPYYNNPNLLNDRRNKYQMQEVLKAAGLRSINQCLSSSLEELFQWTKSNKIVFPIVLKPLESAGTNNVFICHNEAESKQAFCKILSSRNIYKDVNDTVLCQEYVSGQEYMVNTVSWEGEHRIIEVLKINKKEVKGRPLYDMLTLLPPSSEDFKLINNYLSDVYKALGLNYGAAHAEVKVEIKDKQRYVTLIEVGARLGGAAAPSALQEVQNHSQLSVLVKSYVTPGFLKTLPKLGIIPHKDLAAIFFISNTSGILKRDLNINLFKKLKTYHCLRFNPTKGELLNKTQDFLSIPGYVYLVGNKADIEEDIKSIRLLEQKMYKNLLR